MANRPVEAEARKRIQEYLESAKVQIAEVMPMTRGAIARATGYHWKTIDKYVTDEELGAAAAQQQRRSKTDLSAMEQRLAAAEAAAAEWRRKYESMVAQQVVLEGNARRLDIDPAELYVPLAIPPRNQPARPSKAR